MIEVLEMGAAPVIEKVINPVIKPVVDVVPNSKGSSAWLWVVILIVLVVVGYIIYQSVKEDPKELKVANGPNEELD